MITDIELLNLYMLGFNDELDNIEKAKYTNKLEQRAYDSGRIDAIVGDDCKAIDLQTNEEILIMIKQQ